VNELTDNLLSPSLLLLADWSLRWGVVIAVLGAGLAVRPPRRVATRFLLWRLVLVGGLLLPLLPRCWGPTLAPVAPDTLAAEPPRPAPAPLPAQAPLAATADPVATFPDPPALLADLPAMELDESTPQTAPAPPAKGRGLVSLVALLWLAGVVMLTGRLVLGWVLLARLRRSARPAGAAARAMLDRCRADLSVRRAADLVTHPAVRAPVLLWGLGPAIALPPDWEEVPAESRRAALLHELAHLARRDDWAKAGEELVRALFFFHPLVRWLLNRLDGERERLCDAAVVRHGISPAQLARALLDFAERLGAGRPAVTLGGALPFFNRITLKDRIRQLLDDDMVRWAPPLSRGRKAALAAAVLGSMLALGGFGVRAVAPAHETGPAADPPEQGQKPAAVSGIVKDGDGRPVAGAAVAVHPLKGRGRLLLAQTGADGTFAIADLPGEQPDGDSVVVLAGKEGFAPALAYTGRASGAAVNLTLARPVAAAGIVRDREGRPVAGARVQFGTVTRYSGGGFWDYAPGEALRGTPLEALFRTRTDAQGTFRFTTAPADRELIFRVAADGFADLDTGAGNRSGVHFPRPDDTPVALVLSPEAQVNGRFVSRVPGARVEGLHVWLQPAGQDSWEFPKEAWTDEAGRFSVGGLAEGGVRIETDEPPEGATWTARAARTVVLGPGAVCEVELELIEGVLVEGVVLGDAKEPVPGAAVGAHGPGHPKGGHMVPRATTDGAGRYRLRLPPGETEFFVRAAPPGLTAPSGEKGRQPVIIPEGVRTFAGPTLGVQRAAVLEGLVVDARGRPLSQAQVTGQYRAGGYVCYAGPQVLTDSQGCFRLERGADGPFPLGEAMALQVAPAGGRPYELSAVVGPGRVEVRLPTVVGGNLKGPADVRADELAGVVIDEQGAPLEGVHVHAWDWKDLPANQARTGKDGTFRIKGLARERKVPVRFRKPGYSSVLLARQPPGVTDLVVAMDKRTYFEGTVRGPGGEPVPGASIYAVQGPKWGDGLVIPSAWTETRADPSGRYRLYVEPDAYELLVMAPAVGAARLARTAVAPGQVRPLDIRLGTGVDLRAVAVDSETGQPLPGVRLWSRHHKNVDGRTDANGEVTIAAMPPGRFDLEVEAAGYARWWSDNAASAAGRRRLDDPGRGWQRNFGPLDFDLKPGMAPVHLVMEKGVRVMGRVVDPNGRPVAGATVAPVLTDTSDSLTGDQRFDVETRADGTFALQLPASGPAQYNLLAHDGKYGEWRTWANGISPPIRTRPGQEISGLTLTLTKPATVHGQVVDGQGKPVAYHKVRAHAADGRESRHYDPTTASREDGSFELRCVRPGEQFIQAGPFWWRVEQSPAHTTRKVGLAAGEMVEGIDLVGGDRPR
jgi:beta-lactamase regulating signal transducer with metallopeptidase domain/protocatechuate 3,4-dioxygenase beta subunit